MVSRRLVSGKMRQYFVRGAGKPRDDPRGWRADAVVRVKMIQNMFMPSTGTGTGTGTGEGGESEGEEAAIWWSLGGRRVKSKN